MFSTLTTPITMPTVVASPRRSTSRTRHYHISVLTESQILYSSTDRILTRQTSALCDVVSSGCSPRSTACSCSWSGAMDECDEEGSAGILLRLLPQLGDLESIAIRVLVTSRAEMPIRRGFDQMQRSAHEGSALHHMSTEAIDRHPAVVRTQPLDRCDGVLPDDGMARRTEPHDLGTTCPRTLHLSCHCLQIHPMARTATRKD